MIPYRSTSLPIQKVWTRTNTGKMHGLHVGQTNQFGPVPYLERNPGYLDTEWMWKHMNYKKHVLENRTF